MGEHGLRSRWVANRSRAPFTNFLQQFDLAALDRGEREAGMKGAVFAYLRTESPHLQIESRSTTSENCAAAPTADLFAFDEDRLFLAAQVKSRVVLSKELPEVEAFAREVTVCGSMGLIVAFDFDTDTRRRMNELWLSAMSVDDLVERTRIWDAIKQQTARKALLYFLSTNSDDYVIWERVEGFFDDRRNHEAASIAR